MGLFSSVLSLIKNAVGSIIRLIQRFIHGVLSFYTHIVDWFKKYNLQAGRDIPFVVENHKVKDLLDVAPKHSCGVFKGVYNEETDSITHHEFIGAEKLDEETKSVLNKSTEGIVVLQ